MTHSAPRLHIKRLGIVESRSPEPKFIRDIQLYCGLNIVWAEELPVATGGTDVDRAGHGVGKTTFSLMLRAVLGDDGAAVRTMRTRLLEHFGSGGIAAEIVAGKEQFAVFRSFGLHSFAIENGTIEQLFKRDKEDTLDFTTYVVRLGEQACLQYLQTRTLPVTGQTIEWEHILRWIARDQSLGLREYFEWRNDDGIGLRRKVKDPPALLRLALGLLSSAEATADREISSINGSLAKAIEELKAEEQRNTNIRRIVETQLRQWAGVSDSLRMVANDLFYESVEKEIRRRTEQLETKNRDDRAAIERLQGELLALGVDIQARQPTVQLAKDRWQETVALANNDATALKEIRERRDKLLSLAGTCQYGGISYSDCIHIKAERDTIKLAAQRDTMALSRNVQELQTRANGEKAAFDREAKALANLVVTRGEKSAQKVQLEKSIDSRSRQLGRSDAIRDTLTQWQETHLAPETQRLRAARDSVKNLEHKLEVAKLQKFSAQQQVSERAQQISRRIAALAEVFGTQGRYSPSDEKRPFQMLDAEGDAYTVLEILLGDLACAQDGAENGTGAHPGLLILDCPREREMSAHLYDHFLALVDEVGRKATGLQVIVTTTTPPPKQLQDQPPCILKLSHASDDDLLLKRRIKNLLSRARSPSSQENLG